jgi:hypothetical protein
MMQIIFGLLKDAGKTQGQHRNVPVPVAAYNLKSNVFCRKAFTEMNHL